MWMWGSWREDRRLPFHRLPVLDPAGLGGEVHPDFVELARVVGEGVEPTLHLFVRESELIGSETSVVTLDGKIAALVE